MSREKIVEFVENLLLLAAGVCIGLRVEGAPWWVGLAALFLLVAWLAGMSSRPGPNDPERPRS